MRARHNIALAALVGMPLFATPWWDFRHGWELLAIWLAAIAFSFWLRCWWWRIFLWLALIQALLHPAAVSYKSLAMIAIFLGAAQVFSKADPDNLMDLIGISALAHVALMVLQYAGIVPTFAARPAGFFNPDAAGVFLALCLPVFFRGRVRKKRTFLAWRYPSESLCWWHLLPLVLVALVATQTTTGAAAAAAAIMAYVFLRARRLRAGLILAVVAGLSLFVWRVDPLQSTLNHPRWLVWQHTVRTFQSELWGRGLGSYGEIFPFFMSGDSRLTNAYEAGEVHGLRIVKLSVSWEQAHNEYLQTGFEMGIPAMALVAIYPVWVGIAAWRRRKMLLHEARLAACGIAATAISCMGWHTFHIAPLALVGCAWLGMWAGARQGARGIRRPQEG